MKRKLTKITEETPQKEISHNNTLDMTTPDRISLSYSQKIMVMDYQPAEVMFSYSSNVNPGESVEKAIIRVTAVVEKKIKEEIGKLISAGKQKSKK